MPKHISAVIFGGARSVAEEYDFEKSPELCIIMKIGRLGIYTANDIKRMIQDLPMDVLDLFLSGEPRFTCRVWVKQAVQLLNDAGILHADVQDMERAALTWGTEHDPETISGAPCQYHVYAN